MEQIQKTIILLCLLFFLPFLAKAQVMIVNCQNVEVKNVSKFPFKAWNASMNNVLNNPEIIKCLPPGWKSSYETFIKYASDQISIKVCQDALYSPSDCGNKDKRIAFRIIVPEKNSFERCGCIETTLFHELMHMGVPVEETNNNDRRLRGCEKLILPNLFPNCTKIPGNGCDCMDENNQKSPCLKKC